MGAREEVVGDLTPDTSNSAPATSGKLGWGFLFGDPGGKVGDYRGLTARLPAWTRRYA